MRLWPTSAPDYKWPPHFLSVGMAAVRFLLELAFHISYAAGLVLSVFSRRRERVLIIRTDGLGDALLFEPALESLARAMSPRVIHLWAPALTCELLRYHPSVRRLVVIPRGFKQGNLNYFGSFKWRARMGFALGRWSFDKVIYPVESPEPLGNWLFASVRAAQGWINYGDTINQFDWQRQHTHELASMVLENRPGNAHELLRNEYLATQWGDEATLRLPKIHLPDAMNTQADELVERWRGEARKRGGTELIGVVPAASMSINSYPNARWLSALRRLWDEQRVMAILLGGPGDRAAMDSLAAELFSNQVPHLQLSRPMALLPMAATLAKLDGVLSVDTGLAHIAVAQNVPTVVLVGGGHPGRFFPWPRAPHHHMLGISMPCADCHNRCVLSEAECITHISPDEIVAAYARLRGRRYPLEVYVAPRAPTLQIAG
jgi:ADP-heptose:LPS heptosyltransferase